MQVKSGTIFDNLIVTDDEKHAEEVGEQTWGAMKEGEKKMKEAADEEEKKRKDEEEKKRKEEGTAEIKNNGKCTKRFLDA